MKKVKGDLLQLAQEGQFDVIVHGCNCFCHMLGGIAKTISSRFPQAYEADCSTTAGDKNKLGTITQATVSVGEEKHTFTIVNGYTQFNWKGEGVLVDYNAIRKVFRVVKDQFAGKRIGYPMIGAGLARGDWNIISAIIDKELIGEDHTVVEYQPQEQRMQTANMSLPGEKESMNDEENEQDDIEDVSEQRRITQEEDDSENDQDPVAEGETQPENEKVEPSYEKASAIPFFEVCRRLEKLWQLRRDRGRFKKIAEIDKLKALLPPKMIDYLGTPKHPGAPPESLFPLFRLLMPEKDSSRMFLMKESALLKAYTGAFNLSPSSKDYQKLLHFKDATVVQDQKAVGDFSCVLKNVLRGRIVHDSTEKTGSDFTVGDINAFLDELASVRLKHKAAKEAFERAKRSASPSKKKSGKPPTQADFWIDLIRRLNQGNKNLSPLEHKWLVRIIRQEMQFGVGWKSIVRSISLFVCVCLKTLYSFLTILIFNNCSSNGTTNMQSDSTMHTRV